MERECSMAARHWHSRDFGYSEKLSKCHWCKGWSALRQGEGMVAAINAAQALRKSRLHRCLRSCRAAGHITVAECSHSVLTTVAVSILNVLLLQPASMEKQKRWANTVAWCVCMSGDKSIDTADCQESSNISGLCPPQTPGLSQNS